MMRPAPLTKGFTLIELLVVIAIIGMLSSVVFISVENARIKARDAQRFATLHEIRTALELYWQDHHEYLQYPGMKPEIPNWDWGSFGGCGVPYASYKDGNPLLAKYLGGSPQDPFGTDTDGHCYIYGLSRITTGYILLATPESPGVYTGPYTGLCNGFDGWYCISSP